jgi:hypothetical protein
MFHWKQLLTPVRRIWSTQQRRYRMLRELHAAMGPGPFWAIALLATAAAVGAGWALGTAVAYVEARYQCGRFAGLAALAVLIVVDKYLNQRLKSQAALLIARSVAKSYKSTAG